MSDKAIALLVTLVLMAGLLVWGIITHYCCSFKRRRQIQREEAARNLRTQR